MNEYTLLDLCEAADVTPRTVRYYISSGLLPQAVSQGPKATYPASALKRLQLIKALQREHLPLAEIRTRLDALSEGDIAQLLGEPPPPVQSSALDYISRVLSGGKVDSRPRQPAAVGLAAGLSGSGSPATSSIAPSSSQQAAPSRSTWERIVLHADVEVHVRRPLGADTRRKLDRLLDHARTLFQE